MVKRVEMVNAPTGSVNNHQRFMLGVGLDPLPLTQNIALVQATNNIALISATNKVAVI